MVIYYNYTTESGVERVKAYSNQNMMIERDRALYSEADDFAYQQRIYIETDIPIDVEPSPEPETDLTVKDNDIENKILNIYTNIEEWKNPKNTGNPYDKSDKCYYKEQFWVSTVDNNISEPGGLANTWINI